MASKKLIEARIAETVAQKRYDASTVIASAFITFVAIAVPLLAAIFVYYDTKEDERIKEAQQRFDASMAEFNTSLQLCLQAP
ncbi:hypothetical protein ACIA49_13105 [Kribbella sp. NPDC051587]|uniref:hypothetical protein n=1 Tax=Kribbella sp. NPDC051587 TaxID=3364119 RepID=UPI0037874479